MGAEPHLQHSLLSAAAVVAARSCGQSGCPCVASARRGFGLTHCPVAGHGKRRGDLRPSLSIRPGDRGVLFKCYAGWAAAELRQRGLPQEEVATAVAGLPRTAWRPAEDVQGAPKAYTSSTCTSSREGVHLRLVPACSVRPERVRFAGEGRVPLGMVTLLVGQGGLGKSQETCRLAAGWSRGTIAGDFYGCPIGVAIATAEDHRAGVVVPRLLAAGAALSRVHFVEALADGVPGAISIDGRVEELERTLSEAGVGVLVIDAVVAHIPVAHDSYKEQHVRAVLKPLAHMAERCGMAVLGVMHLNPREARDVLTRISGSGAFGHLARSVLLLAADPEDPDGPTRILAAGKSNVGAQPSARRLRIEGCSVMGDDGDTLIYRGALPSVRIGHRRLVSVAALNAFVAELREEAER